jgi:hypothetical protein
MSFFSRTLLPPRLAKETRQLLWPWFAVVSVVAAPLWLLVLKTVSFSPPTVFQAMAFARLGRYLPTSPLDYWAAPRNYALSPFVLAAMIGLLLGCALLVALSFGAEFQHRTLPMLLGQPCTRLRLWGEKMLVLAGLILLAAAVYVVGMSHNWSRAVEVMRPASYTLLPLVCSAGFWTLFARSTLGGVVFSVGSLGAVLMTVVFAVEKIWEKEPVLAGRKYDLISVIVGLAYAALFLWLSWRKFSRLELNATDGGESGLGATPVSTAPTVAVLRCRPGSPLGNLVRKELRLLRPLLRFALLFVLFWWALVAYARFLPKQQMGVETLLHLGSVAYIALSLLLAGCLSLCEERSLGLHVTNLTQPVAVGTQRRIKFLVALAVGLLVGVVLPIALSLLTGQTLNTPFDPYIRTGEHVGLGLAILCLLVLLGQWSAAMVSRVTHAILLAALAAVGVFAAIQLGIWLGGGNMRTGFMFTHMNVSARDYFRSEIYGGRSVVSAPDWFADMTEWIAAHGQLSSASFEKLMRPYAPTEFMLWPVVGVLTLVLAIQAWRAFRVPPKRWSLSLGRLTIATLLCAWLEIGFMRVASTMSLGIRSSSLYQETQAAFAALKLPPVPPVTARRRWIDVKISLAELEATGKLSAQTKYWLRNATLKFQVTRSTMSTMSNARIGAVASIPLQDYAAYFGVVVFPNGEGESFQLGRKVFYLDEVPN